MVHEGFSAFGDRWVVGGGGGVGDVADYGEIGDLELAGPGYVVCGEGGQDEVDCQVCGVVCGGRREGFEGFEGVVGGGYAGLKRETRFVDIH